MFIPLYNGVHDINRTDAIKAFQDEIECSQMLTSESVKNNLN